MAKAIDPPAKALGYTDCGEYIAGVSFGKHDEEIHSECHRLLMERSKGHSWSIGLPVFTESFSFLVRWELARRLQPNGPIEIKYLTDDFLKRWKGFSTEQEVCDEIHKWAQRQQESTKRGTGRPKLPLPKALDSSFWTGLAAVGGEAAAMEAGNLSFQVAIERHTCDGPHFRMKMAPPVLENSGRLLRLYPTQRIIRAKIDQELLYRLQDPLIYVDDDAADDKTLGKRDSARNLVARFQKLFYKPIHLLGKLKFRISYKAAC